MAGMTIDVRAGDPRTLVSISGVVDEDASFEALDPLAGAVEINLRGLRRFNSTGVRAWVDAIRALCLRAQVQFVECSSPVVFQLNMITGFLGRGRVVSFYAPMRCDPCDAELDQLYQRDDCEDGLAPVPCPTCGRQLELDDVEDQYLLFLREPTRVSPI